MHLSPVQRYHTSTYLSLLSEPETPLLPFPPSPGLDQGVRMIRIPLFHMPSLSSVRPFSLPASRQTWHFDASSISVLFWLIQSSAVYFVQTDDKMENVYVLCLGRIGDEELLSVGQGFNPRAHRENHPRHASHCRRLSWTGFWRAGPS